ncbi:hypothetical protein RJ639_012649, partial [Escallonia herrerae]
MSTVITTNRPPAEFMALSTLATVPSTKNYHQQSQSIANKMGSLEGKAVVDVQDESLVSPRPINRKTSSLDSAPIRSFHPAGSEKCGCLCICSTILKSIRVVFLSEKINLLIPCGPLAMVVDKLTSHHVHVQILSLKLISGLGLLSELVGHHTFGSSFGVGYRFNHVNISKKELGKDCQLVTFAVGALLNATFGNATELIISTHAMKGGMIRVVQQSLLGSILSNMLLVLGCAFFGGGIVHPNKEQVFDKVGPDNAPIQKIEDTQNAAEMNSASSTKALHANAAMNSGLLLMAVMGLLFPAVLHVTHTELHYGKSELALSRFSSCVMLVAYGVYLYFQLTHQKSPYSPINEEGSSKDGSLDDEEAPEISKWESVIWLSVLTAWISYVSEYLVNAIEGASVAMNMPVAFISVILLPIVGNAAEHAGAVMFAVKDKLDISLGVAIGSSTQIAMFGIPFCVVVGWIIGCPMDLNFQLFETATLLMTVLVVTFMLQEGNSNYFKGLMLIFCYLIVSASFFVHKDPKVI